ncbi:Slp family lipoprotein [Petrachloros mirabilis]
MFHSARLQQWTVGIVLASSLTVLLGACSAVPRRYLWMAESDVTLSAVSTNPDSYVGKVVLLGGVIIGEEETSEYLWLRVMNRPLDRDYVPHRPANPEGPEAGLFWVMVEKQQLPRNYRTWGRTTIVGRVMGAQKTEPLLQLLYMRGWDVSGNDVGIWEIVDPNYVLVAPGF